MHRKLLLTLFCVFSYSLITAQSDTSRLHYAGISYFSEGGFYPGFAFTYERSLLSNRTFEMNASAKAGAYFHYRNHTGVFVMIQSGQRFRLYKNLFYEHYLGIGYLHTFLNGGDAYYVDAAGQVHEASNGGNPHFMPSVSFGLSYLIDRVKNPMRFFTRPVIFWQIPFNQSELVQYGFEAGVLIRLKP
jgi:hypothetical protein